MGLWQAQVTLGLGPVPVNADDKAPATLDEIDKALAGAEKLFNVNVGPEIGPTIYVSWPADPVQLPKAQKYVKGA